MSASIGFVVLVSGATGLSVADLTLTFPLAISVCMLVIGVVMMVLGYLCYRRYFTSYMKRKRAELCEKIVKLSLRELPHRLAFAVDDSSVFRVIVPTDGTIPEVLEWEEEIKKDEGKSEEDEVDDEERKSEEDEVDGGEEEGEPSLPILKSLAGLMLSFEVDGVPVNVVTIDIEQAELYPGMFPWHRHAITCAAIAATFVDIVLITLVLAAPNLQGLETFFGGFGVAAGVCLALTVYCGLRCYEAYRRGERSHHQHQQTTP